MRAIILIILLLNAIVSTHGRTIPGYDDDEARLLNDVLGNYNKNLRPVLSKNHSVVVTFGLTLNQIIDVIEKFEILKLSLYIRQIWRNPLLAWNKTEYGGIHQVNLNPKELWKPDIYLYNNADTGADGSLDGFKAYIKVESSGLNKWMAPTILTTSCKINVKYFPFDQQACTLKFGSWTYDAGSVDIVAQSPSVNLDGYQLNGEWDLIEFPCVRNEKKYICCPYPFTDVTCTLHIRRRTLYFWVNLIIPCLLITVLSLLSFIVTTESGERISLVITNLLALTVFMLIVADILPPTSEVVPLISVFITCSITEVGLSLVATCFVLRCYHTNPDINEMPFWMRYFVCDKLGKLLRVTRVSEQRTSEEASNANKTRSTSSAPQLRNMFFGYSKRAILELLNAESRHYMRTAATSCKHCQAVKSSQIAACASRQSSIYVSPESMYKDTLPDNVNVYRGRNDSRSEPPIDISIEEMIAQPQCSCGKEQESLAVLGAIVHRQDHIVEGIMKLTDAVDEQNVAGSSRDEWIFAAHIIDRFFLYCFIIVLCTSIVMTFAMIPSYGE